MQEITTQKIITQEETLDQKPSQEKTLDEIYSKMKKIFHGAKNKIYSDGENVIKKIKKKDFNEIEIVNSMQSSDIIKFDKIYETFNHYYIVMKYYPKGDLFSYIINKKQFTEMEVKSITKKMLKPLVYMYNEKFIIHCDIKPENFLIDDKLDKLILIDFEMARYIIGDEIVCDVCQGTEKYVSPERFSGIYSQKTDIWSLGVIIYMMFANKFLYDIIHNIDQDTINYRIDVLNNLSKDGKEFLKNMLKWDYTERLSYDDIINDPWLNN